MLSTNHWQLKMCFCFLKRTAYAYVTCQDRPSKCQWTSSIVKCASSSFSKRNFPFLTRPHLYRLLVSASNARTPYASPSHHPLWIVQKPTIAATSAKGIHRSSQIKPFSLVFFVANVDGRTHRLSSDTLVLQALHRSTYSNTFCSFLLRQHSVTNFRKFWPTLPSETTLRRVVSR